MSETVVIDSCVFNKLFLDEDDSETAIEFLAHAKKFRFRLGAPSIFLYEVLAVAASRSFGAQAAYGLIETFMQTGFEITELGGSTVKNAIDIANTGHPKTGYPTFYDSAYHAFALERGGIFLTSDQRHIAKAASHGSVALLKEWKSHFKK